MKTFSELSLSPVLQANLKNNAFSQPTPVQAQSIPPQLNGLDLVITAQTGTGKTLAFVLPLLEKLLKAQPAPDKRASGPSALILSPTRELAMQTAERETVLGSATIGSSVAHLIQGHLKNPLRVAIGSTTKPAENIDLHIYEIEQDRKLGLLEKCCAMIRKFFWHFARTKHGADRLAKKPRAPGGEPRAADSRASHAGAGAIRPRGFQEGSYRVLVATDVAARGVHVEGIAHVVNYDLPQVPEDFIHRVGRTGRAGMSGTASTFSTREERSEIRKIEKLLDLRLTPQQVPAGIERETKIGPRVILARFFSLTTPHLHARLLDGTTSASGSRKRMTRAIAESAASA